MNNLMFAPLSDFFESLFHVRKSTTPGKKLRLTVGPFNDPKHYEADAQDFIHKITKLIKIKHHSKVLEVGCGSGRLIFELFESRPDLSYYGFDIVPKLISWARNASINLDGKFHFTHSDIYNYLYNPEGKRSGENYIFPYNNASFDLVIIQSVFTHMLYRDMRNYIKEVYRVLKPGGKVVATFFLINKQSSKSIKGNKSDFLFKFRNGNEYLNDQYFPEAAVAYDEETILSIIKQTKLLITNNSPIFGAWYGRKGYVYQDLFIMEKSL